MSRALVAIGVSRAGSLQKLPGAANDAGEIAAWAKEAGYQHVHALTDGRKGTAVKAEDVYLLCERLLKIKDLERLVIFFAGHGISPWPGNEFWLLSGWDRNANQAINASTSLFTAQGIAKPQISFIADACRLTAQQGMGLNGMAILPRPKSRSNKARVDEFFATTFGDASQEIKPARRRASYGVFSAELLKALKGAAATTRNGRRVVTSRSLDDYLTDQVPRACSRIPGAAIQRPGTRAQWRRPKDDYADFPLVTIARRGPKTEPASPPSARPMPLAVGKAEAAQRRKIDARAQSYQDARGRGTFETATGVTIIGARIKNVVASRFNANPFEEKGVWHLHVVEPPNFDEPPSAPSHLMIQISSSDWPGYWISVPTFPGLVATAVIDENGFSSLNYQLSRRFQSRYSADISRRIAPILAEASAMFRYGKMPTFDRAREMIHMLRMSKGSNPALAVIAAHICYRIGELAQIKDMERYPIGGLQRPYKVGTSYIGQGKYTPYDLMLLSGRSKPAKGRELVGTFPLMSPGWGLLAVAQFDIDPRLQEVLGGLTPSLWTMATPKAGEALAELISGQSAPVSIQYRAAARGRRKPRRGGRSHIRAR